MFSLQGFAPCTAHDAANLHGSCGLQSVLFVGGLYKSWFEVTWMCSRVRVSTRSQASNFDKEALPNRKSYFPEK